MTYNLMKIFGTVLLFCSCVVPTLAQSPTNYNLNVGEFSELRVSDGVNVDYTSDASKAGRACFECPSQQASMFMFTNKGGKLTIQLAPDGIGAKNLPTISVYSKYLTKVENTSDSTVRVLSVTGAPKFEARLEGNGHLIVRGIDANEVKGSLRLGHGTLIMTGKCKEAKLNLTGTGVIQADELVAEEATVSAKGTGSVGVNATKSLGIFGMGSTSVYYVGDPTIKNRSVGLKLMPLAK